MPDVNVALVFVIIFVVCLCAFVAWCFFFFYRHPMEHDGPIWPQIVTVFSLTLTLFTVLLPPLDIANGNGGIPMDDLWYATFYMQAIMLSVITPFAIFYHQAYNTGDMNDTGTGMSLAKACQTKAMCMAFVRTVVASAILILVIGLIYFGLGQAKLQIDTFSGKLLDISTATDINTMDCQLATEGVEACDAVQVDLTMDVTFSVYCIAIVAFIGWWIFAVFAGVGLYAIPIDCYYHWRSRVRFLDSNERAMQKELIGAKASKLYVDLDAALKKLDGEEFVSRENKQELDELLKDKETLLLHFKNFKVCEDAADALARPDADNSALENLVMAQCVGLVACIFSGCISLLWTIHIIVYMLWVEDPLYGFLNDMLVLCDRGWEFLAIMMYSIFSFYMMLCVIKGNSRLGLSVGFITLHPLQPKETIVSSFLVNTQLMALASFAVVQFCMHGFRGYAGPNSSATAIFNVAARNLTFLEYWYRNNVFVWILILFAALSTVYLCLRPPPRLDLKQQFQDAVELDADGSGKGNAQLEVQVAKI